MTVTWTRTDLTAPLLLEQKLNYPSGTWESVASNLTGDSYLWTVPATLTTRARLRVRAVSPVMEAISRGEHDDCDSGADGDHLPTAANC